MSVYKDNKDQLDIQVKSELRAHPVTKAPLVLRVLREQLEVLVNLECKELLVIVELLVFLESRVLLVPLVFLALKGSVEALA